MVKKGKGKLYNNEGKIIFKGEYIDGKICNCKGYDKNGNKEYEIKKRIRLYKRI